MSLINNIIPTQGFELVRDAIGAILFDELSNQKTLQNAETSGSIPEDITVYIGRSTPFQQSERLMINVSLESADYTNNHQKGTQERTIFYVDIYTSAKETEDDDGGYLSTKKRDKFLGMIRYILQDHHYQTLGFEPGLIMSKSVDGFENFEPNNSQDAAFVKMSRLTFSVRINENQSLWDGVEINRIFTNVRLNQTDLGYQYEYEQIN